MSKVFFDVGVSLEGFIAGPHRGPRNPLGDGGPAIHAWMFRQKRFRQNLGLGDEGETGEDNRNLSETFDRIGANVMGKRMFEEGEANWPESAPFHTPVFVLTHERRSPMGAARWDDVLLRQRRYRSPRAGARRGGEEGRPDLRRR